MHLIVLAWDVHRPGHLDPAVRSLVRALAGLGHRAHVITLGTGPTSTAILDEVEVTWVGEPPPVLPAPRSDHDMTHVLGVASPTAAAAERVCQAHPVDAVLAVGWQTVWAATTIRASRDLPLVAWLGPTVVDGTDDELVGDTRLAAQAEWWLTYEARRVVAETEHGARLLRRAYRLPPGTVDVLPPAMEPAPTRDHDDDLVVLIGGPPAVAEHVAATGARVTDDPADVTRAAVAVVLDPSCRDVALTALAAGTATVVVDDPATRRLVHQRRSGVRVDRDDVVGIVDEVTALLRSPRRRQRMGEAARRRIAERHRPDRVAAGLVEVMAAAVDEEARLHAPTPAALRPLMGRAPALRLVPDGSSNGHHRDEGTG